MIATRLLKYSTAVFLVVNGIASAAQDHQHDTSNKEAVSVNHEMHTEAAAPEAQQEAMDHSSHQPMQESGLRDPHAYSNGYSRTSGPYYLPGNTQLSLADEEIFSGLWIDRMERVAIEGTDATEIQGHAWMGGSYNRLLLKTEAEILSDSLEHAELDLLWSHAVTPFWNLQVGARQEIGEGPDRTWAAIGIAGLAPYWFEIESSFYAGENGRTAFDLEAEYELLLTQRLILQPRVDISAYGKADPLLGRGKGLSTVETGLRLRYEFSRQFAPYLGVERVLSFGETADLLPAAVDRAETRWVLGLRFWF